MKKKKYSALLLSVMIGSASLVTSTVKADSVVGESIYTLGENLTNEQQKALLTEMDYKDGEQIIYVTNKEEHTYLGGVIPAAQIGTRAISSSRITTAKENTGIIVSTRNISWVTAEMYTNALVTAGVKDASIYITAPFSVSGTAALTGLMKAYELSSGETIDEETKKVANEEMVTTAELADDIGTEEANNLMTNVKNAIAEESPKTTEDIQTIVDDVATDLNITLTDEQFAQLVVLFEKMLEANIDWDAMKEQIDIITDSWGDKFQDVVDSGFFDRLFEAIGNFFESIAHAISNFFSSILDSIKGSADTSNDTPSEEETNTTNSTTTTDETSDEETSTEEGTTTTPDSSNESTNSSAQEETTDGSNEAVTSDESTDSNSADDSDDSTSTDDTNTTDSDSNSDSNSDSTTTSEE